MAFLTQKYAKIMENLILEKVGETQYLAVQCLKEGKWDEVDKYIIAIKASLEQVLDGRQKGREVLITLVDLAKDMRGYESKKDEALKLVKDLCTQFGKDLGADDPDLINALGTVRQWEDSIPKKRSAE